MEYQPSSYDPIKEQIQRDQEIAKWWRKFDKGEADPAEIAKEYGDHIIRMVNREWRSGMDEPQARHVAAVTYKYKDMGIFEFLGMLK